MGCPLCLTRNDNSKIICMACAAPKPGHEEEVKKMKEAAKPATQVMTIGAGGGFKFGGATSASSDTKSTPAASGFSFGTPSTSSGTSSGFSFGTPVAAPTAAATTTASSGFSF